MKNFVELKVTSKKVTSEYIENAVGIKADFSWKTGDLRKNTKMVERCNGYILQSTISKSLELNKHLEFLLDRISSSTDEIRKLSPKSDILFSCAIYSKSSPSLYFDNDILKRISALNADFDIDIYITDAMDKMLDTD